MAKSTADTNAPPLCFQKCRFLWMLSLDGQVCIVVGCWLWLDLLSTSAVQALHAIMKGSLDLMSVGIGKEKRKKDTVGENTSSEKPDTNQKELGDVKWVSVPSQICLLA